MLALLNINNGYRLIKGSLESGEETIQYQLSEMQEQKRKIQAQEQELERKFQECTRLRKQTDELGLTIASL